MRTDFQPLVSIVIPIYNGREYTLRCLETLSSVIGRECEAIVVDNGSTDGSSAVIAAGFPEVRILRSEQNLGYAGGCNLGIRASRGNYILLLNNDTRLLGRDWLGILVRCLEADPRLGILGVREVDYTDHAKVLFDGGQDDFGFPKISGAAMFIRRSALGEVGLLDETFFAYYEDSDLVARLRKRGWGMRQVREVSVAHARSLTAGMGSPFYYYYMTRNFLVFVRRHAAVSLLIFRIVPRWIHLTAWFMRSAMSRRRWDLVRAWTSGMRDGLRAALADQPVCGPPLVRASAA